MIVVVLYLMSLLYFYPYLRVFDDQLALLAVFQILLLLMAGAVIQSGGDVTSGSPTDVVMSIILFVVVFTLLVMFVYHGVVFLRTGLRIRQRRAKMEEKPKEEDAPRGNNEPLAASAGSEHEETGDMGIELQPNPLSSDTNLISPTLSSSSSTSSASTRSSKMLSPAARRALMAQQLNEAKG